MLRLLASAAVFIVLFLESSVALGQHTEHSVEATHAAEVLGNVSFTNSCAPAVSANFNRAVALLHSFEFRPAIEGFADVLCARSACAIAHWGIALAYWGNPFAGARSVPALEQGLAAVRERARHRSADGTRARLHRRGCVSIRRLREPSRSASASSRTSAAMAERRESLPRRRRGADLPCVGRSIRPRCRTTRATRRNSRQPRFSSLCSRCTPTTPGCRTTSFTRTTIRRSPRARSMRPGVTPRSRLLRRTRCTCRRTRSRASAPGANRSRRTGSPSKRRCARTSRPKRCTRWTIKRTRTCRWLRIAPHAMCSSGCRRLRRMFDRRSHNGWRGAADGGLLCAGRDPGALRARAGRMAGGRRATGAGKRHAIHDRDRAFRARARRRACRPPGRGGRDDVSELAASARPARGARGSVLGRAGGHSVARRQRVGDVRGRAAASKASRPCVRRPISRMHRQVGGDAGSARAGSRAARRDAARGGPGGRGAA